MSRAVVEVFVRLYEQGLIYRGKRLVNWDPVLGTAVSDLEVDSEEEDGKIWTIRYPLEDGGGSISVATTRPETMLGDVAVAVNPRTSVYKHLIGKRGSCRLTARPFPSSPTTTSIQEVRHRGGEDHAGARLQRLPGRPAPRPRADQRSSRSMRRINDSAPAKYRGLDRFEARKQACGPRRLYKKISSVGKALQAARAALGPHRRDRRADAHRPVVRERWRQASPATPARRGGKGRGEVLPRALDQDLQPVAREHPGLVHLAPALVGPPDPGLVRRRREHLRRARSEGRSQSARLKRRP